MYSDNTILENTYEALGKRYFLGLSLNENLPYTLTTPFYDDISAINRSIAESLTEQIMNESHHDMDSDSILQTTASVLEHDVLRLGRVISRYDRSFQGYLSLLGLSNHVFLYLSEQSEHTCERCSTLHGQLFTAEELANSHMIPPLHPNCNCKLVSLDKSSEIIYYWSNGALTATLTEQLRNQTGGIYQFNQSILTTGIENLSLDYVQNTRIQPIVDTEASNSWWESLQNWAITFSADVVNTWDIFWTAQAERTENMTNDIMSFLDWLTVGIVSGAFEVSGQRAQDMTTSPSIYTIANWITLGVPDMLAGTFSPESPLSFEHWMNSLGTVSLLYGAYSLQQRRISISTSDRLPTRDVSDIGTWTARNSPETNESIIRKLDLYLLDESHPTGGSKAKWFKQALGFTRDNLDELASQIIFDEHVATLTDITEYGVKYNQTITIAGANGKVIDVTFAWIKDFENNVRLVTAIPTKN